VEIKNSYRIKARKIIGNYPLGIPKRSENNFKINLREKFI
jgi:hypothetical protein